MINRYRKWFIHISASLAFGLILLDETVVAVALPTIQKDFSISLVLSHWIINSYLLIIAGFIAVGGKLGDIFGFRKLFVGGLFVFGISSVAAGFAENATWLITARTLQGFGAAVIFPTSVALIAHVFPVNQRGFAMGIYGGIGTSFLSLGPLVGGYFTNDISWRWIFWINIPIVTFIIITFLATWKEPSIDTNRKRFDYLGLITLVTGISSLVLGIMQGPIWGWNSNIIIILFIASASLLILFYITEQKVENPLIELELFSNSTFSVSNLQIFTGQFCKLSVVIFSVLYFQQVLKMDPLKAGLALLPAMVPIPLMSILGGKATDLYGPRYPSLVGLFLGGFSVILLGYLTGFNRYEYLLPVIVLYGFSQPLLYTPPRTAVSNSVPIEKQGQASGIVTTAQMVGATISVAVLSAVLSEFKSFELVFIITGVFVLLVALIAWFYMDPEGKMGKKEH